MVGNLKDLEGAFLLAVALPQPQAEVAAGWLEHWRQATVALGQLERKPAPGDGSSTLGKERFTVLGSAVILGLASSGPTPWLVSAKHMFIDKTSGNSRDSIQIRFAWFAHQSVDEYVGVRLALTGPNGPLWIPHPDPAVDLACIRLRLRPEDAGKANVPAVVPEAFIGPDELLQGADVLVLGCPSAAGALYWTEPVARKGIIGWVSPDDPLTQPILIDANTSPGNSGGPVFRLPGGMDRAGNLVLGGRVAFLGIVSKALPEYVPVTAADGRSNVKIPGLFAPSLVGLTVVESAQRVRETLEAAAKAAP